MGRGIALAALQAGIDVFLYDTSPEAQEQAVSYIKKKLNDLHQNQHLSQSRDEVANLHPVSDLTALGGAVIIEAIVEELNAKIELFQQLAASLEPDVIFCTNTSSLSVTRIAEEVPHPERVVGMHFFNPADRIALVEVVATSYTAPQVVERVFSLARRLGKTPVRAKDVPGFIVNRIGKLYHTEPLFVLEQNVASHEVIDELMEAAGFRMGPFRLIDLIGLDANLNVTRSLYAQIRKERFRPSALQEQMVRQGLWGRKSGKGFYTYEKPP